MRILAHTRFYPSIGGVETVASLLAHEWCKNGEEIIVASDVACFSEQARKYPFPVVYQPSRQKWLTLMRWCDVYLQFNVSLKASWPLLLVRRPLIVSHQGYYWMSLDGKQDWRNKLKLHIASMATNIFVSQAMRKGMSARGVVIPNTYDDSVFSPGETVRREIDLAFVGRLVSDKGADYLLRALAMLSRRSILPTLSIIGDGPERIRLEDLCAELDLSSQVKFLGEKSQTDISALLQHHRILVVPSLVAEGYPVVALEGLASGCLVIGSEQGGLPEAIGPGGLTFPNGNAEALAEKLELALVDRDFVPRSLGDVESHLAKHRPAFVARRYLEVMRQALSWT